MKILCIVPCGKKKIWDKNPVVGETKAKDAYIGLYAKTCKEYAERFYPSSWCFLSAKYGFLFPDDIVKGNYNISFKNKSSNPITSEELIKQAMDKGLNTYDKIISLGGKDYSKVIKEVFRDKVVYEPLKNLKIGQKLQKLKNAINEGIPLS
jgi:hypothetical protein